MNKRLIPSSIVLLSFFAFISCQLTQTPKSEAEKIINKWYETHAKDYHLKIPLGEATTQLTSYHNDKEVNDRTLVRMDWKGMQITMQFQKPLKSIHWNVKELQKNIAYVVIDDIYNDITLNGWKVYPRTPSSSSEKALTITAASENEFSFEINWETYTVSGYSDSDFCQEQLEIMDAGVPDKCYVGVRKRLPLRIEGKVVLD